MAAQHKNITSGVLLILQQLRVLLQVDLVAFIWKFLHDTIVAIVWLKYRRSSVSLFLIYLIVTMNIFGIAIDGEFSASQSLC